MPDTYSSTDIGMAGDRIILAVYLTWYRYQIFPAGYLDRTEYFFILGGLADNLAGYLAADMIFLAGYLAGYWIFLAGYLAGYRILHYGYRNWLLLST